MSATGSAFGRIFQPSRCSSTKLSDRSLAISLAIDVVVFALLFVAGALAIHFHKAGRDFVNDDVAYFERARSLLQTGVDGINGRPETTQPPGLPVILAGLYYLRACSYGTMLGLMAVFEVLGFGATYLLLRREIGRIGAAAVCLVLVASPLYFSMATQWVAATFPFLFASMSALLAARKLEEAETARVRTFWAGMLAVLGTASIMLATAGIVLLGAIVLRIAFTYRRDQGVAMRRLKGFAAVLLVAIAAQGLLMHRTPAPLEWPIPGYPQPYLQQLWLKSGHNPELGYATWKDVVVRVGVNARDEVVLFVQLFSSHWINTAWWSVAIMGPLLLILTGWGYEVWRTRGESLEAWFFAGYQGVWLLWPWKTTMWYFLPIAPFACLYLWRGRQAVIQLARRKPRLLGIVWAPMSAVLAGGAIFRLQGNPTELRAAHGIQGGISCAVWALSGIAAAYVSWASRPAHSLPARAVSYFAGRTGEFATLGGWLKTGTIAMLCVALLGTGIWRDREIKRDNLNVNSIVNRGIPDVEAAKWIQWHTSGGAVVMARHVPITYYYANRKVVWFPPSSNADLLMNGIVKYKVDYILTVTRGTYYYLPPDNQSTAALLARYPGRFRLVETLGDARIFQVTRPEEARSSPPEHPNNN